MLATAAASHLLSQIGSIVISPPMISQFLLAAAILGLALALHANRPSTTSVRLASMTGLAAASITWIETLAFGFRDHAFLILSESVHMLGWSLAVASPHLRTPRVGLAGALAVIAFVPLLRFLGILLILMITESNLVTPRIALMGLYVLTVLIASSLIAQRNSPPQKPSA